MTSKTEISLRKLSTISQSLNQASDELSSQLDAIETALNQLNLGVSAWVDVHEKEYYDDGANQTLTDVLRLGYGKYKHKWGLLCNHYCAEFGEPDVFPLKDTGRDTRMEVVEHIPQLLDSLAVAASQLTAKASERALQAKEIAVALSKGRS